ncbi:MAG: hypothetical protein HOG49_01035 [Candidatus Scalindua sp.]|nr:hypothetical protein [Candidatus Scalindua sp.]
MAEKKYVNGIWFTEKTINRNDGSSFTILKASIKSESFAVWLDENTNDRGYVNIDILKSRQANDKGNTHYATLNDYKPKTDNNPF